MDVDEGAETQQAIDAILEDSEQLEHNEEHAQERYLEAKRRGKQKAAKTPHHDGDMWKELKRLQSQLASLQSANKRSHDDNATGSSKEKRRKVDVDNEGAFDRPTSSRSEAGESSKNKKQLSSAKSVQLSSAKSVQLSTAKRVQLSPAKTLPQLSSAKQQNTEVERTDDALIIENEDNDDPLREETEEIQRAGGLTQDDDVDMSSDEDNELPVDDSMFADLVGGVNIVGDDEQPGPPVTQIWADKINLAWKVKISKLAHTSLLQKYKTPSNLNALKVPSVNKEIWKPLNKYQKKADLSMTSCQRSLIGGVSAVLQLHNIISIMPKATRQSAMQITADIVSLLGKVNRELMTRRKISARSVLVGDYKTLATTTEVSEENLFGDNLSQDI